MIDTNDISEARKGRRADSGVIAFFGDISAHGTPVYLSAITVGELRRGMALIRHRGDVLQAQRLWKWLQSILADFTDNILVVDSEIAQVWGELCAPRTDNPLDKLIAATALIHGLTVVTRNTRHFALSGVRVLNPFGAVVRGGTQAPRT